MGFFEKLGRGLAKTRDAIFGSIGEMEKADRIDEDTYEELLEQLVLADTGLATAEKLVEQLRERVKREKLRTGAEALGALKELLVETLTPERPFDPQGKPAVILVIGVNGVARPPRSASWPTSMPRRASGCFLRRGTPSGRRRRSSCRSGPTAPGSRWSATRRARILRR